nr:hypothetical protein [Tanacetum cinerariifolium]
MGFKASSSWVLASKGFVPSSTSTRAWLGLIFKVEKSCEDEMKGKIKCVCHWADPFEDLKWSNVSGVKLSSLSELDDTFPSLQALLNLHYLFSGFMDYFWSRELNISNFGPADW